MEGFVRSDLCLIVNFLDCRVRAKALPRNDDTLRHCEERSDAAIQKLVKLNKLKPNSKIND